MFLFIAFLILIDLGTLIITYRNPFVLKINKFNLVLIYNRCYLLKQIMSFLMFSDEQIYAIILVFSILIGFPLKYLKKPQSRKVSF